MQGNLPDLMDNLALESGLYLAALFLICMLCHGELVRIKPGSRHLTLFYLMIAAGGVLGGLFVALVCPRIFTSFVESDVCLIGGACSGGPYRCCKCGGGANSVGQVGGLRSPAFR